MKYHILCVLMLSLLVQGCASKYSSIGYRPTAGKYAPNYEQFVPNDYGVVVVDNDLTLLKSDTKSITKEGNYPPGVYTIKATFYHKKDFTNTGYTVERSTRPLSKKIKIEAGHRYSIIGMSFDDGKNIQRKWKIKVRESQVFRYKERIHKLSMKIKEIPDDYTFYNRRADLKVLFGNKITSGNWYKERTLLINSSINDYKRSMQLGDTKHAPKKLSALYFKKAKSLCGDYHTKISRCKKAIEQINKVINLFSEAQYYRYRASYQYVLQNYDAALNDINRAINMAKEHEKYKPYNYVLTRGLIKLKMKDYAGASKDLNEAYTFAPTYKTSGKKYSDIRYKGKKYKWEELLKASDENRQPKEI